MNSEISVPPTSVHVPTPVSDQSDSIISEWLGGSPGRAGFLRTSLDLTTRKGLEAATRMSSESTHDNSKIDKQTFTIDGYAIKAVHDTDQETGEVKIYPRATLSCTDGTHLVFCGKVALQSILLLACCLKPEEWTAGIKIRVHVSKNKFKTLSHQLELVS